LLKRAAVGQQHGKPGTWMVANKPIHTIYLNGRAVGELQEGDRGADAVVGRFLLSWLHTQGGKSTHTGIERMKQRGCVGGGGRKRFNIGSPGAGAASGGAPPADLERVHGVHGACLHSKQGA
jgi:hypothetical protein